MVASERLGVFGGTFDPIHIGHLVAAVNAKHAAALDRVLFVVAGEPWQKAGRRLAPSDARFDAVVAATDRTDGFEVSRLEIDRTGPSYTVDTLRHLRETRPEAELFLIVGDDTAARLHTWREPEQVAELATLVILNRPGEPRAQLDRTWRTLRAEMPPLAVSSTDLRSRLARGRPVDFLIPGPALDVIRSRRLYAGLQEMEASSDALPG